MSQPKPQQEPSMEEILASIRRIISEDGTPEDNPAEAPAKTAAPAASPKPEPAEETGVEDVLELTEVVEDEAEPSGSADRSGTETTLGAEAETDAAAGPTGADEVVPEPRLRSVEEGLLSDTTAGAAESRLSSLVAAVDRAQGGTPIGAGNRTIEDLVKEVMRPMIKDWLDAHLPGLVERVVRREIERLSRRAEGDE